MWRHFILPPCTTRGRRRFNVQLGPSCARVPVYLASDFNSRLQFELKSEASQCTALPPQFLLSSSKHRHSKARGFDVFSIITTNSTQGQPARRDTPTSKHDNKRGRTEGNAESDTEPGICFPSRWWVCVLGPRFRRNVLLALKYRAKERAHVDPLASGHLVPGQWAGDAGVKALRGWGVQ